MPIIGLTDRGASFPRIGTLRKGAPKPENGKTPGKDLNHFRFDSSDQAALAAFAAAYGAKPQSVHVFLPFASVSENFVTWQEEYAAGGLVHRCDGQTMVLWRDAKGRFSQERRPCPYAAGQKQRTVKEPGCRPVGSLKVVIPELKRLAYVSVATTSIHDIMELQANLEAMAAMRGDLRGIPFVLSRRARMISMPTEDGKRVRREKWLLSIEPSPDWVALQLQAMEARALPERGQVLELAARAEGTGEVDGLAEMDAAEYSRDGRDGHRPDGARTNTSEMDGEWVDLETGEVLDSKPAVVAQVVSAGAAGEAAGPLPGFGAKLEEVKRRKTLHAPVEGPYGAVMAVLTGLVGGREKRLALLSALVGRTLSSSTEMTLPEQVALFETLKPYGGNGSGWHIQKGVEDTIVRWCMAQGDEGQRSEGGDQRMDGMDTMDTMDTDGNTDGFPELAEVLHPQSAHVLTAVEAGL